ncbi:MAG: aminotransferase class V-fold PLP-dependent enzyme [Thermaceae bacterium]|nr:aminotransferase class V-fold PLP-dependent enzyme [Thermaceae bacterium]
MIDLTRARNETPGIRSVAHFNNAGAALMPQIVLEAVKTHLDLEAEIGGYEAARTVTERLEGVYASLARLINCSPREIAVVENATRAWDMAFYSIPFRAGDRILTSQAEYASNYIAYLQVAKRSGAIVEVIPNDAYGQVDIEQLAKLLERPTRLVSITHIPTNGGLVNPAAEIGQLTRERGVLYLLDACQSVGQMPVDVAAIGCDLLSATSRKYLRGPRGVGFLYVREGVLEGLEPPFLDLHAATWVAPQCYELQPTAKRFENWECSIAAKLGLGVAVDYALRWGLETTWLYVQKLGQYMREAVSELPGVQMHDQGRVQCGIVSFTLAGHTPDAIRQCLSEQKINVNVSRAPSTLLDMTYRGIQDLVRASVHYYNNLEEIDRMVKALQAMMHEVRV